MKKPSMHVVQFVALISQDLQGDKQFSHSSSLFIKENSLHVSHRHEFGFFVAQFVGQGMHEPFSFL
jgi:hypothetical protein